MKNVKNKRFFLIIIFSLLSLLLLIILFIVFTDNKEGFVTLPSPTTYSDTTVTNYNNYIAKVKSQGIQPLPINTLEHLRVPEASVNSFVSTGSWPWSSNFTDIITRMIMNSPTQDMSALAKLPTEVPEEYYYYIYSFMQYGQLKSIGKKYKVGCNVDSSGSFFSSSGDGMYELDASGAVTSTLVENSKLPTVITGFTFLDDACNPCNLVNSNYSCPFAVPYADSTSNKPLLPPLILQYLWGINSTEDANTDPNNVNNSIANQFSGLF